ncbi:MAG: FmdB family transcriptional regulator [Ilumatobacteraceae bacterium]|jgi:predicted nucleic acid-binding Zn ribbon protein|nr:FmdB family transcriptional regulator [Ilumatobacteraceae bacterium]
MPTYVYKFIDTGETIEVQQAFTDDALTEAVHPSDGSLRPVKKVFTPVGITFKGGGFYKTDNSKSGGSSSSTSSAAATPATSDSSSSSSDSTTSSTTSSSSSTSSAD